MPAHLNRCPVCQSPIGRYLDKFYERRHDGHYSVCECANPECLLCFLTPQLSVEEIATLYDRTIPEQFDYPDPDTLEEAIHSYSYVVELVKKWRIPPASVIEVGPAQGYILAGLKRANYDAIGIESSSEWRKIAQTISQTAIMASLDDLESYQKADVVVMWHVLDHIPNPLDFLLELKHHLNGGALLFIQVPSYEHIAQFKESFRESMVLCGVHVNHFTRYNLANLLWKAGFSLLSVEIGEPPCFFMTAIASINSFEMKGYQE